MPQNIFVKISGDLIDNEQAVRWIAEHSKNTSMVVCVGGGTDINNALVDAGIPMRKHGPLGREHQSEAERAIADEVLAKNVIKTKSLFKERAIDSEVIAPIINIGGIMCHVNGDQMILAAYLGFDQLFVLTTVDRVTKKEAEFANYAKVKVVGF